jgi:hypothetical protein
MAAQAYMPFNSLQRFDQLAMFTLMCTASVAHEQMALLAMRLLKSSLPPTQRYKPLQQIC